jgi:hypothetical protein
VAVLLLQQRAKVIIYAVNRDDYPSGSVLGCLRADKGDQSTKKGRYLGLAYGVQEQGKHQFGGMATAEVCRSLIENHCISSGRLIHPSEVAGFLFWMVGWGFWFDSRESGVWESW